MYRKAIIDGININNTIRATIAYAKSTATERMIAVINIITGGSNHHPANNLNNNNANLKFDILNRVVVNSLFFSITDIS